MTINVAHAQIERVEPPNWWVGFKDNSLQLMVKGEGIGAYSAAVRGDGITLEASHGADSPNYIFLDLSISRDASPGEIHLVFSKAGKPDITFSYPIKERIFKPEEYVGFSSEDAIYLITPDRFANGDTSNDIDPSLQEKKINRKDDYARHGGDIRGMIDHLDYIADLGFTAIWPSPLLINDMPRESYHGYAITDYYRVDPRFGTLDEYKELVSKARAMGIKVIMDQVNNHCGLAHWWMKDLPFTDWIHYQEGFEEGKDITVTNHRRTVNQDMYASDHDRELMDNGWFVPSMPDLNQDNPFLAKYLIQNSLWWIETLGLGGIRQDTYPYPEKHFMARWAERIMTEYPSFSIVGEEWSYNPLVVGYWQRGAQNRDGYESHLRCTMDFPLQQTLVDALKEEEDWNTGLIKLYEGLANDFHYASPEDMMLFGDNHDMDRLFTQLKEDEVLTRMALAFIMVAPRIPQVYYGTEILMENSDKPGDHGLIRTDFPGGWQNDRINAFTGKGLDLKKKHMQEFVRKLAHFRKGQKAIHHGGTKHFSPENGVYVLFRYLEDKMVMLILNKNDKPITLPLGRFAEMNISGKQFTDVFKDRNFELGRELVLEEKGVLLLTN
ncbi:glycoside hydrolase family 13 protein [Muriicola marianensis]|uniref:Neopullulanase SusA n=1 Tax=Muriicola marianensis TaxID=1324801 RepID=A0ABQ1R1M3_9FLAO|nr:glycoside hydrolase family 13 protein [Muriicola marianensis]GGD53026.1 neopullulanase SusA [Muriicola marianensis]